VQAATPTKHFTEVDKDGQLENGVGCEVLELKPELLQQQQEEQRNRQSQPTEEIGNEEHKLPGGEVAEGGSAGLDPPGKRRRAPSKQATHCVERHLGLVAIGMNQRGHGNRGGEKLRSTSAEGHERLGGERAEQLGKMQKQNHCTRKTPFSRKGPHAPWGNPPGAHLAPGQLGHLQRGSGPRVTWLRRRPPCA
jgi:hypothetical protein